MELYKKYRPQELADVLGQDSAVGTLGTMLRAKRVPHAMLFAGPSGTGKTTLARILRVKIGCGDADFTELNCADFRGVDMVRDIRGRMNLRPIGGRCRVWLIDEAHQMTGDAQNAFLKILEDTPGHVYFMLCTTNPGKLLKTVQGRCTPIVLKDIGSKPITDLVTKTAKDEELELSEEVITKITENSEGSARKALVLLDKIRGIADEDEQLAAIAAGDYKAAAIEIARALINPATKWPEMAKILKAVDDDPEGLRHMVLAYCTTILLGGGKLAPRAFVVVDEFSRNFYDSKRAGLVAACYSVLEAK